MAKIEFVVDMDPEVEEEITPGPFGEEGRDQTRPGRFVSELLQDATNVLSPDGAIDRAISHPLESERDKLPRRTFLNFLSLFPELGSVAWNPYDTAGMISGALSGATGISPSDPGNLITGLGGEDYESKVPGLADYKRIASEAEQNRDVEKYEQMKEGAKNTFALERMFERPLDAPLLLSGLLGPGLRRLPMIRESPELMKLVRLMEDPATASVGAGFPRLKQLYGDRPDFIKPTFQAKRGWNYLKDVNLGKYFNKVYEGINTDGAPKYGFTRIITNPDLRVRDIGVNLKGVGSKFLSEAAAIFLTATSGATRRTVDLLKEAPGRGLKRWTQTYGGQEYLPEGGMPLRPALAGPLAHRIETNFVNDLVEGADQVKKRIDEFQAGASKAFKPWKIMVMDNDAMLDFKDRVVNNLKEFGVGVEEEFVQIYRDAPLRGATRMQRESVPAAILEKEVTFDTPTEGRQTLKRAPDERGITYQTRSGTARIIWPRQLGKGKTSPISKLGDDRKKVGKYHKDLLDAPPTTVENFHNYLMELDQVIASLKKPKHAQALRSMVALRKRMREFLGEQMEGAEFTPDPSTGKVLTYDDVTAQYELDLALLDNLKTHLNVEPGMRNTQGVITGGRNRELLVGALAALDDGENFAFQSLIELERATGQDFTTRAAALATMPLVGSGLVSKSHAVQKGNEFLSYGSRMGSGLLGAGSFGLLSYMGAGTLSSFGLQSIIPATVGLAGATIALVPAAMAFSPRYMSKMLLEISDPVQRQNVKTMFSNIKEGMQSYAKAKAQGVVSGSPAQWIEQGATMGQVAVRLANAGDWESDEIIRGEQIDTIDSGLKEDWDRAKLQYPSATSQQRGTIFVPEE
jgi:hypothetical protein